MKVLPIILCGGSGTRLWPLSNNQKPKQFHPLTCNGATLCQQTADRISMIPGSLPPLYITSALHADQLPGVDVLLEHVACDTAVAVARGLKWALENHGRDILLLFVPADHAVASPASFAQSLSLGLEIAEKEDQSLVLFGLDPEGRVETKYGYILSGPSVSFFEKPDTERAAELISRGALWNSGIVTGKAGTFLTAFETCCPEILQLPDEKRPSFDVLVLQRWGNLRVVRCEGWGWSDVGTWDSWVQATKEVEKKSNEKSENTYTAGCENVTTINRGQGKLVVVGVKDIHIVVSGNDVLVTALNPGASDKLKSVVTDNKLC